VDGKELQKTRRERIAYYFSLDGGYRWVVLVPLCAAGVAYAILGFPAHLMLRTQRCTAQPDPAYGTSKFVSGGRWCPPGGGYRNPKTDNFIDIAAAVTLGLFGLFMLLALAGLIARKIFGDPRYPPDLRQGFKPMDDS